MLYTKKGDAGTTSLADNTHVCKSCNTIAALGAVDELNAFLGLCKVKAHQHQLQLPNGKPVAEIVDAIQHNLFTIQAACAGAEKKIALHEILSIETIIDMIEKKLPPITHFCVPGGSELSALFDIARTMTRHVERVLIASSKAGEITICENTKAYVNRLSSLLFALARWANHQAGIAEQKPRY